MGLIYFVIVPGSNAVSVIDCFVNAICICLMFDFEFSNNTYEKLFGKRFHPWLRNFFIKKAIRQSKVELELSEENETEFKLTGCS